MAAAAGRLPEALLFDCDGVLVDTGSCHHCWGSVAVELAPSQLNGTLLRSCFLQSVMGTALPLMRPSSAWVGVKDSVAQLHKATTTQQGAQDKLQLAFCLLCQ